MQKLKLLDRNLEALEKLISSCLDYLIFLLNPQLLNLIHYSFAIFAKKHKKTPTSVGVL
jgi:hypothetical protein